MKTSLYIVGAGGLGREVLAWAFEIPAEKRDWELKGFLNSIPAALDGYEIGFPILCDPLEYNYTGNEYIICAIGDPLPRLSLCHKLLDRGARFINIIHPTALVSKSAKIDPGCIIATDALISSGAHIGPFVTILGSTFVGSNAIVSQGVTASGFCSIGEQTVIGEGVFLGSHAIVEPKTIIGPGARIGARTVVSGEIPPGATYFGVPGRMIAGF